MSRAIIGTAFTTGEPLSISDIERRSGLYILGKTGMGKTSLIINLIDQDIQNGHGVFFLDPHGDAITTLIDIGALYKKLHLTFPVYPDDYNIDDWTSIIPAPHETVDIITPRDNIYLLNPENETHSFGLNFLECNDITSLEERTDTYTRAHNIFKKLWEDSWGVWLQSIVENTLYALIEAEDYTLAEMPMFIRNPDFRNHVLTKVKYNTTILDFWREQIASHPPLCERHYRAAQNDRRFF